MAMLKMNKEKYSGLDGRTYVRFTESEGDPARPFTLTASPSGIHIKGQMVAEIEDQDELQEFARILSEVQSEHLKLRKAQLQNISRPH